MSTPYKVIIIFIISRFALTSNRLKKIFHLVSLVPKAREITTLLTCATKSYLASTSMPKNWYLQLTQDLIKFWPNKMLTTSLNLFSGMSNSKTHTTLSSKSHQKIVKINQQIKVPPKTLSLWTKGWRELSRSTNTNNLSRNYIWFRIYI